MINRIHNLERIKTKMHELRKQGGRNLEKSTAKFTRRAERQIEFELREMKYVVSLEKKHGNLVKKPLKKKLRKSIDSLIDFIPREMLDDLMLKTKTKKREELIAKLIGRVVFLPEREFNALLKRIGSSTKRNTVAINVQEHAFINLKNLNKYNASEMIVHEIIHAIFRIENKYFKREYNEVLPVALEFFINAEQKKSRRQLLEEKARKNYSNEIDHEKYIIGVNTGQKVFLIAESISKKYGRKAAIEFFQDLFRSDVLSKQAILSTTKYIRQKYSQK